MDTAAAYTFPPLEQAYGMYLLENCFHIDVSRLPQRDRDDGSSFRIPGGPAVQFLIGSNLPITLLRSMWSTVDPTGVGSLTSPHQFYAILRLVALGQVGILTVESIHNDDGTNNVMVEMLTAHPTGPLAVFQGIVRPDESFLRSYYEHKWQKPFPAAVVVVATDGRPAAAVLAGTTSIADAFDSLLDISDAPLPSLPPLVPPAVAAIVDDFTADHNNNNTVELQSTPLEPSFFPGSDSITPEDTSQQQTQERPAISAEAPQMDSSLDPSDASFADFMTPHQITNMIPSDDDDNNDNNTVKENTTAAPPFLPTIDPTMPPNAATMMMMTQSTTESWMMPQATSTTTTTTVPLGFGSLATTATSGNWDALDALVPSIDAPPPVLVPPAPPANKKEEMTVVEEDDTFGDFEGIESDGLAVEEFVPTAPVATSTTIATEVVEEDTTFGDFEGVDNVEDPFSVIQPEEKATAGPNNDAFSDFETSVGPAVDDCNDAGPSTSDAPNDLLAYGTAAAAAEVVEEDATFGDFEGVDNNDNPFSVNPPEEKATAGRKNNAFSGFETSVRPTENGCNDAGPSTSDAPNEFPAYGTAFQESPHNNTFGINSGSTGEGATESMRNESNESDGFDSTTDDEFGTFETSVTETTETELMENRSGMPVGNHLVETPAPTASADPWGAFDLLAAVEDKPLPSLQEIAGVKSTEEKDATIEPASDTEGTDFGDFQEPEDAAETPVPESADKSPLFSDGALLRDGEAANPALISGTAALAVGGPAIEALDPATRNTNDWDVFDAIGADDSNALETDRSLEKTTAAKAAGANELNINKKDADLFGAFVSRPEDNEQAQCPRPGFGSNGASIVERLDSAYYSAQERGSERSGSDDFGRFADAQAADPAGASSFPSGTCSNEEENQNNFGFHAPSVENPSGMEFATLGSADPSDDEFDAFGSAPGEYDAGKQSSTSTDVDDFFAANEIPKQDDDPNVKKEDCDFVPLEANGGGHNDFNAVNEIHDSFAAFEMADMPTSNDSNEHQAATNPEVFATAETTPIDVSREDSPQDDVDDFADFEQAIAPVAHNDTPAQDQFADQEIEDHDEFNDFGDFASVPHEEFASGSLGRSPVLVEIAGVGDSSERDIVVACSAILPPAIRCRLDGSEVDLSAIFDEECGSMPQLNDGQIRRKARFLELMRHLYGTQEVSALDYWSKGLHVVHRELTNGTDLLDKAAAFIRPARSPLGERASLCNDANTERKAPVSAARSAAVVERLSRYLQGLARFVLVSRCVAAALGNLYLVEESTLLSDETFSSSWHDLTLAKSLLDVERHWKTVLQRTESLMPNVTNSLRSQVPSIADLRRVGDQNGEHCSFTLLPLSATPIVTSMTPVVWNEKKYFACSANFLANCCTFYDPKQQ